MVSLFSFPPPLPPFFFLLLSFLFLVDSVFPLYYYFFHHEMFSWAAQRAAVRKLFLNVSGVMSELRSTEAR